MEDLKVTVNLELHIAKIKCSICNFESTAYHSLINQNGNRKWIPSNFVKHFKTHFSKDKRQPQIVKSGNSADDGINRAINKSRQIGIRSYLNKPISSITAGENLRENHNIEFASCSKLNYISNHQQEIVTHTKPTQILPSHDNEEDRSIFMVIDSSTVNSSRSAVNNDIPCDIEFLDDMNLDTSECMIFCSSLKDQQDSNTKQPECTENNPEVQDFQKSVIIIDEVIDQAQALVQPVVQCQPQDSADVNTFTHLTKQNEPGNNLSEVQSYASNDTFFYDSKITKGVDNLADTNIKPHHLKAHSKTKPPASNQFNLYVNTYKKTWNLKWKDAKYSRAASRSRSLISYSSNQKKITDFFATVTNLLNTNTELQSLFQENIQSVGNVSNVYQANPEVGVKSGDVNNLLKKLMETAQKNNIRKKNSRLYHDSLKRFALYIFIIGGRLLYKSLYKNLQYSLPSITTINRLLCNMGHVAEGKVRLTELSSFLTTRKYRKKIFISEDQTALIRRVEYDAFHNKVVGFVGPLLKTGFPTTDIFKVNSISDIQMAFENHQISCNAYLYMAQPLDNNSPGFVLSVFGSNNVFDGSDVLKRWTHLQNQTLKMGIEVTGFSSDGDPRCLKAMKCLTNLPCISKNPYGDFF